MKSITLDVNGVGYEVFRTQSELAQCAQGERVRILFKRL